MKKIFNSLALSVLALNAFDFSSLSKEDISTGIEIGKNVYEKQAQKEKNNKEEYKEELKNMGANAFKSYQEGKSVSEIYEEQKQDLKTKTSEGISKKQEEIKTEVKKEAAKQAVKKVLNSFNK
ncbi:hypothetical protein DMB95_06710 [Campylobacter sp. MIT 12-8780]|uniref:hypothetical protein n=1 Tax=unclassified Campylobacter TaxID=2593542 RepID=UPI0010F73746|nr:MULTISPECIES: hypothetical protein [unclassified Campylobacter]NDJ27656.1 hypothetical protein [Campylobacter sp. MIT 19-121]TKX29785.1 hypothetical protein CQA38_03165 [Campylobacter sp. MIT 12-5580]TQR40820.1 hypothetical protein DMB95_06710 [Campylobacter sp. MIT 12-8780]